MRGVGTGVAISRTGTATWLAPRAQLSVSSPRWVFGMRIYAAAEAALPYHRPPFMLGETVTVHQSDPLVWRLGSGLEFDWP
jgi:hypothetical protein